MSFKDLIDEFGKTLEFRETGGTDDYGDPIYGSWTTFIGRMVKGVQQSTTRSNVDESNEFNNKVVTYLEFDEEKEYQFREQGKTKEYTVSDVQRSTDDEGTDYYYLIF